MKPRPEGGGEARGDSVQHKRNTGETESDRREMEQTRKARPVARKRAKKQVRLEPAKILPLKADGRILRKWAADVLIAVGWAVTAALVGAVAARADLWVVFEVGFAAAFTFGTGIGWKIAEEVMRDDRR